MSRIHTVDLPDIGEGVVEGEVVEWLKKVGDPLGQDEPVVVVMTDKATVELPAPYPGKLAKKYIESGQTAIKDRPLYDIAVAEDVEYRERKEPQKEKDVSVLVLKKQAAAKSGKAIAAPAVRRLARELGLDLAGVRGTGPNERVMKSDLAASKQDVLKVPSLAGDHERALNGIRGLMAKKMAESKRTAAHFSYFESCETKRLIELRRSMREHPENKGINITYMPFFILALSRSLKEFPDFNSAIAGDRLILHKQHNIGIAIASSLGLIVPNLKEVEKMSLKELIFAYEELKRKALLNKLKKSDMQNGTATISNFGGLKGGGQWATPVLNAPEVAILAMSRIRKQPTIKEGELAIVDQVNLSWSFDHRVIDGDMAAAFSHYFSNLIENPLGLL